jgi:short-subunit dehydrogenase
MLQRTSGLRPNCIKATMPRTIVITGASSGIGRALALHYAVEGRTLGLLGRDPDRLGEVAGACRARGAQVSTSTLDVCDREELATWLAAFDAETPVDLLVANAGIMGGVAPQTDLERPEESYALFATNVTGVLNTIHPMLPTMVRRGAGQMAILSSLAGLIPVPDAPSYAASKAAVLSFGLSLRTLLYDKGVRVNVICPGYVSTPMTAQELGWKPFEMSAERAAALIARGLERDKAVIAFPRILAFLTRIGALLPESLRRATGKPFRFRVSEQVSNQGNP